MQRFIFPSTIGALIILFLFSACSSGRPEEEKIDATEISKAMGFKGSFNQAAGVFKISEPRRDINTAVAGIKISPGMGLIAWASFTGTKQHTVLIGEVPLREDEVNGFLSEAIEAGLEVTALHNTFLWDNPNIMSLHFSGTGNEVQLASSAGTLFKKLLSGKIPSEKPRPFKEAAKGALSLKTIHQFLWKGEFIDGVYRVSTGRGTELSGLSVGESMGVNSWASFSGSDDAAIVNGDIAMLEYELKDVLKALIETHINIVSIHTHLTKETPKLMFVHYWGTGKLEALTKGVHAALEKEKNFRGSQ